MSALCLSCATVMLTLAGSAAAQAPRAARPDEQDFRRAVAAFWADPFAPQAADLAKVIIVFTLDTRKAMVVVDKQTLDWFGDDDRGRNLMVAYFAGSVSAQLDAGVKVNDPYSGLIQTFRLYRLIRARDETYKNARLEELLTLYKDGKLEAHLAKVKKHVPAAELDKDPEKPEKK
jgi:hypothetical protein